MGFDLRKWGAGAAAAALAAPAAVYLTLSASLPRQSGAAGLPGVSAPVTVELDERAVPRIRAASLEDALRAQGFVHAQQRFFQMDLARRSAAGELAALFGERALPLDRARRVFQFRARGGAGGRAAGSAPRMVSGVCRRRERRPRGSSCTPARVLDCGR